MGGDGPTALHMAASMGRVKVLRAMLDFGDARLEPLAVAGCRDAAVRIEFHGFSTKDVWQGGKPI